MDNFCSWCRSARWQYRCSTCDPRKEKVLCSTCSMLWHSRGFARSHQLTSSYGETRSYLAWGSSQQDSVSNGNGSAQTEAKPAANGSSGVADGVQVQEDAIICAAPEKEEKPNGEQDAKPEATTKEDTDCPEKSKHKDEEKQDEQMQEEFEFEVVGESVDSGEDGGAASVENKELEEKATDASAEETPASTNSVSRSDSTMESSDRRAEEQLESNGDQEHKDATSVPAASTPTEAPTAAVSVPVQASATPTPGPALSTSASDSQTRTRARAAVPATPEAQPRAERTPSSSRSTPQPKTVDLDKLLRWFPTTDHVLIEMLATRVEEALVIEDALICARIGKCEEPACRSVLLHYEHCKRDEMCGDPKCTEISIVYRHRRACLKKDTAPTIDGKTFVCPFCIRIRQRRSLGVVAALDHLISDQRRALQGAHSEAYRNFCLQSINTWNQRKQVLRDETERLNQLASESSAPIFNFPRYQWHFSDAVFIKREPAPLESENNTTGLSAPESSGNDTNESAATEQPSSTREEDEDNFTPDDEANTQQSQDTQEDSIPGNANFNADFINELLRAKTEDSDGREVSQREFDGVMELGYAIVDASFCAPSKAQRCLLNCKSILVHLQHHLDLQVCTKAMCAAVEHHFAHLSQCKARDESESCEYCLRVEERQLIRSVDFMEAEQPEAEAKVQKIINDITASFTNHRPDEREQEVIQLEDELDQAEANKQELLEKLSSARINLRKVRRSMERQGMSTSASRRLPVHFIKVRRAEGSGSSSKKRRLAGSFD